tara:strand:- start:98 stop:301 length:204 start_codon:yes stop_codon:yes gene_type:complete
MKNKNKITTEDIFNKIDDSKFYLKNKDKDTINIFFSKDELISYLSKIKLEYSEKDRVYKIKNKNELM